jgi:SAM-dependent methyltransferase
MQQSARGDAPLSFTDWEKRIPHRPLVDRDAFIIGRCADKDVLHLGATDAPMTEGKAAKGELLHQKLQGRCRSLVGLDNDVPSIELLRDSFGINDIRTVDLSRPAEELGLQGDVVLCGDIIEHVNSVGDLLANCNRLLRPGGELIVSTINGLSLKPALRALRQREAVHPDHVAYYSYGTLGTALQRFGFEPTDVRFFQYGTVSRLAGVIFGTLYRLAPQSADGIIMVATKAKQV